MTVICKKIKTLFSLNPRTASTSVSQCLIDNYQGEMLLHDDLFANNIFLSRKYLTFDQIKKFKLFFEIDIFTKITTVRNPFDSIVSSFLNRIKYLDQLNDPNTFIQKIKLYSQGEIEVLRKNNFNDWILFKYGNIKKPFLTQNENYSKHADVILKFENLQKDFDKFCDDRKIPKFEIPRLNVSDNKKSYKTYYNFISKKIISFVFEQDLKNFHYTFD